MGRKFSVARNALVSLMLRAVALGPAWCFRRVVAFLPLVLWLELGFRPVARVEVFFFPDEVDLFLEEAVFAAAFFLVLE
jgi:hypothetical protein